MACRRISKPRAGRRAAAFRDGAARERSAAAEAKATQVVSDAIADGNVDALNYFVAQRYVDAFAKLASAPNQRTLIVPAEFSGLAGALGGVTELLRQSGASAAARPASVDPVAARRAARAETIRAEDAPPAFRAPPTPGEGGLDR